MSFSKRACVFGLLCVSVTVCVCVCVCSAVCAAASSRRSSTAAHWTGSRPGPHPPSWYVCACVCGRVSRDSDCVLCCAERLLAASVRVPRFCRIGMPCSIHEKCFLSVCLAARVCHILTKSNFPLAVGCPAAVGGGKGPRAPSAARRHRDTVHICTRERGSLRNFIPGE